MQVLNLGGGVACVQEAGKDPVLVDCHNPLLDARLVLFHRQAPYSKSIKDQVEAIASQYRRLCSQGNGNWEACQAESMRKGGHAPVLYWVDGRLSYFPGN